MSNTEQVWRSVAEIIGWENKVTDTVWSGGVQVDIRPGPTVDDMLAWLDDPRAERHGWHVVHVIPRLGGDRGWVVRLATSRPVPLIHGAATLHAALEAAVRAVAEVP